MKNIEKLLMAYGAFYLTRKNIAPTQDQKGKMMKMMADTHLFIEKCIKTGLNGFEEEQAKLMLTNLYSCADAVVMEVSKSHETVAGEDSILLKDVAELYVINETKAKPEITD